MCSLETGALRSASTRALRSVFRRGGRRPHRRSDARRRDRRTLRSARDQPVDVIDAHREHDAVDQHEQHERRGHRMGCERRDRIGGPQDAVCDPWLPAGLGDDPAGDHRDEADPPGMLRGPQIPPGLNKRPRHHNQTPVSPARIISETDADHDAECEERRRDRWPVARRHALEAGKQTIPAMGEEKRGAVRDRHRKAVRFGLLVGPGEQHEIAWLVAVPVRLDRRDLHRLMRKRIEAVLVADEELQRRDDGGETYGHAEHGAAVLQMPAGEDVARPDGEHDERRRQIGRRHHMREAIREARIEDDGEPVERIGDAIAHLVSDRRLHPAVGRQDPERRERRADRDGDGRQRVQPGRHPVPAEQHHAEKRRLEKEGDQDLVADHRPDDIPEHGREPAPVGAELV